MTDRTKIATRAYFLHKNRSGKNWEDSLSNWLQAEQQEASTPIQDEVLNDSKEDRSKIVIMDAGLLGGGIDKEALRLIREHTQWSIPDCLALLKEHGTSETAIKYYNLLKDNLTKWHVHCKNTIMKVRQNDFWLSDFLCHETQYLCASSESKMQRWGAERRRMDNLCADVLSKKPLTQYVLLKEFAKLPEDDQFDPAGLSNTFWEVALRAGRVPRFEPDWLHSIKEDPMCKLRILESPEVARNVYIQNVRFPPKDDTEIMAKYISESITQAEQYLVAANAVRLQVRPLLLYYAMTNLVRAILAIRTPGLRSKFKSHGLAYSDSNSPGAASMTRLHEFKVHPTTRPGLFNALISSYKDSTIDPLSGPWSLSTLLGLVPELAFTLREYAKLSSRCERFIDYFSHTGALRAGNCVPHFAVTHSFLTECGAQFKSEMNSKQRTDELIRLFPGCIESNRNFDRNYDPGIRSRVSLLLGEPVTLVSYQYCSSKNIRSLCPLLFDGGTDGNWYLIYNNGKRAPHQLMVIMALLYGMSMLVRYKPIEWSAMLTGSDGCREVIEEFTQICKVKIPALATEEILHRKILGSLEQMPH